jgi:hypothetical protein
MTLMQQLVAMFKAVLKETPEYIRRRLREVEGTLEREEERSRAIKAARRSNRAARRGSG